MGFSGAAPLQDWTYPVWIVVGIAWRSFRLRKRSFEDANACCDVTYEETQDSCACDDKDGRKLKTRPHAVFFDTLADIALECLCGISWYARRIFHSARVGWETVEEIKLQGKAITSTGECDRILLSIPSR
jgi:hypothetical protein